VQKSDKIAMKKYTFATMKMHIFTFLKGMAMGIAEIIPGVSGGTIAFITGIYERLLDAIKSVNLSLIKTLRDDGIAGFWKAIDGNFLLALFGGMVVSIILFAKLITGLMDTNKDMCCRLVLLTSRIPYQQQSASAWMLQPEPEANCH
jgi:uncharacterized membrane protein